MTAREGLFDFFVKYSYTPSTAEEPPSPSIAFQFPSENVHKDDAQLLSNQLQHFCLPDSKLFPKRSIKKGEKFLPFVLTKVSGEKRYGFAMRVISSPEEGSGKKKNPGFKLMKDFSKDLRRKDKLYPTAFCFLTKYCWSSFFEQCLDHITKESQSVSEYQLEKMLKQLQYIETPVPGQTLRIPFGDTIIQTRRASMDQLIFGSEYIPDLLLCLDAMTLVQVYLALLLERRLIFISSRPGVLGRCVLAANALISPFTWQHVFIPILPHTMLDVVCAPMPFVLGTQPVTFAETQGVLESDCGLVGTMPVEEVVFVDLDNHITIGLESIRDYETFPPDVTDYLASSFQRARMAASAAFAREKSRRFSVVPSANEKVRVLESELHYFVAALLGGTKFKTFLGTGENESFDQESFVADQRMRAPWAAKFLSRLEGSQLFHMMTQTYVDPLPSPLAEYDSYVSDLQNSVSVSVLGSFQVPTNNTVPSLPAPTAGEKDFVVMSGWLCKQGLKSGAWQDRFFLLSRTQIQYKKTANDTQPQGVIPLNLVEDVFIFGEDPLPASHSNASNGTEGLPSKDNCLGIVTQNRTFYAYAENLPTAQSWRENLLYRVSILPVLHKKYPMLHVPSLDDSSVKSKKKGLFARKGFSRSATTRGDPGSPPSSPRGAKRPEQPSISRSFTGTRTRPQSQTRAPLSHSFSGHRPVQRAESLSRQVSTGQRLSGVSMSVNPRRSKFQSTPKPLPNPKRFSGGIKHHHRSISSDVSPARTRSTPTHGNSTIIDQEQKSPLVPFDSARGTQQSPSTFKRVSPTARDSPSIARNQLFSTRLSNTKKADQEAPLSQSPSSPSPSPSPSPSSPSPSPSPSPSRTERHAPLVPSLGHSLPVHTRSTASVSPRPRPRPPPPPQQRKHLSFSDDDVTHPDYDPPTPTFSDDEVAMEETKFQSSEGSLIDQDVFNDIFPTVHTLQDPVPTTATTSLPCAHDSPSKATSHPKDSEESFAKSEGGISPADLLMRGDLPLENLTFPEIPPLPKQPGVAPPESRSDEIFSLSPVGTDQPIDFGVSAAELLELGTQPSSSSRSIVVHSIDILDTNGLAHELDQFDSEYSVENSIFDDLPMALYVPKVKVVVVLPHTQTLLTILGRKRPHEGFPSSDSSDSETDEDLLDDYTASISEELSSFLPASSAVKKNLRANPAALLQRRASASWRMRRKVSRGGTGVFQLLENRSSASPRNSNSNW